MGVLVILWVLANSLGAGSQSHSCLYVHVVISVEGSGNCGSFECYVRFHYGVRHIVRRSACHSAFFMLLSAEEICM